VKHTFAGRIIFCGAHWEFTRRIDDHAAFLTNSPVESSKRAANYQFTGQIDDRGVFFESSPEQIFALDGSIRRAES